MAEKKPYFVGLGGKSFPAQVLPIAAPFDLPAPSLHRNEGPSWKTSKEGSRLFFLYISYNFFVRVFCDCEI
jgi:hypothetical protein